MTVRRILALIEEERLFAGTDQTPEPMTESQWMSAIHHVLTAESGAAWKRRLVVAAALIVAAIEQDDREQGVDYSVGLPPESRGSGA